MSVAVSPPVVALPDEDRHRFKWTVEDFLRGWDLGLFPEDARLELIEGEIFEQMRPKPPHVTAVDVGKETLDKVFRPLGAYTRQEHPIEMGSNDLPMPDLAVVPGNSRLYATQHPSASVVWLVVEVADTTLLSDRRTKVPLYARAGIPECWIVNLQDRQLEVFRNPQNGVYTETFIVPETGSLSPLAAPNATLTVAELLP